MPKKTARAARPSQQRSKEEQWRKRMAAQARTNMPGALVERDGATSGGDAGEMGVASAQTQTATRSRAVVSGGTGSAHAQSSSAAVQRRAMSASRTARARLGATALSIEEEMRYIKTDIRRLIILTAICLAVIIVLSIVVPYVI